jgi:hypothetical protein
MTEEVFRLPLSSYDELRKLIEAYTRVGGEQVSPQQVAGLAGVHRTIVSRNNAFLVSAGIVSGGKRKAPTDTGRQLGIALSYGEDQGIRQAWARVVENTPFLQRVLDAVRIRRGMDAEALATHIAVTAGEPRRRDVLTGSRAIVEILVRAGALEEDDNTYRVRGDVVEAVTETREPARPEAPLVYSRTAAEMANAPTALSVRVNLNIAVSPEDLPTLAAKIKGLVKELSERAADEGQG